MTCVPPQFRQKYAIGIALQKPPDAREGSRLVKILDRVLNPREIRRRLGMNQEQFWTQIGVTQSGGSRYESGRDMPRPVKELLRLVHVEQLDLSQVKRIDFEIITYLKESHPDLYRTLRRAVKSRHRHSGEGSGGLGADGEGGGYDSDDVSTIQPPETQRP
jgi:transcriptional regulator with XRE-family HTH domain